MSLSSIALQFQLLIQISKANLPFVLQWLAVLWIVFIVNLFLFRGALNILGIHPRRLFGIIGIPFAPFLHGDWNHLFFNSIPLFLLMQLVLIAGHDTFYCVSLIVIGLGGIGVWLFGRPAVHLGASGLIMGYWGYLLMNITNRGTANAILLLIVCVYYLGGLVVELLPGKKSVSWEGHLSGFLAGIAASYLCLIL